MKEWYLRELICAVVGDCRAATKPTMLLRIGNNIFIADKPGEARAD